MKCNHCNSEIENDALFCPNCGKKVSRENQSVKHDNNDSFLSKPWVIILMLALLCLFAYLLFFQSRDGKASPDDTSQEEVVSKDKQGLADIDSVSRANAINEQHKEDSLMNVVKQKSDSLAYLKDSLEHLSKGKPSSKEKATSSASSRQTTERRSTLTQTGTKNLGYGTYKGPFVYGKPHGVNGRLVFKTYHQIDSNDPKERIADPGDYVIGEFYDGHLVQGVWYDANNQVKGSIIIGKP